MSCPASPRTRMRPMGPASPMAGGAAAAYFLGRRQVEQVGPMALARMEGRQTGGAPGREQPAIRLDRAAELRNVVAEHFAEAPGLEEIALHVDNQQRAMGRGERERIGLGLEVYGLRHCSTPLFGGLGRQSQDRAAARRPPSLSTRTSVCAGCAGAPAIDRRRSPARGAVASLTTPVPMTGTC